MYRALIITTALLPFTLFAANEAQARCCCYQHCHCCSSCAAPAVSMNEPTTADQTSPPSAPIAGQTQQYQSVQPDSNPPSATGTVYRSYTVQPRRSTSSYHNDRPQDAIVNRHLHPGTYRY